MSQLLFAAVVAATVLRHSKQIAAHPVNAFVRCSCKQSNDEHRLALCSVAHTCMHIKQICCIVFDLVLLCCNEPQEIS